MRQFRRAKGEADGEEYRGSEAVIGEVSTVRGVVKEFMVYAHKTMPRPVGAVTIDDLATRISEKGIPFTPKGCTRYSEDNIIEYQLDMTHSEHGYIIGVLLSPTEKTADFTEDGSHNNAVSGVRCSIDYYGTEKFADAVSVVRNVIKESYEAAFAGKRIV